jgi:hypothetical protein
MKQASDEYGRRRYPPFVAVRIADVTSENYAQADVIEISRVRN